MTATSGGGSRKAFGRPRGSIRVSIYRVVRAVADASGEAAKAATEPGSLDLTAAERAGYADDVREARDRIREVTGVGFDLPDTVEVQHRHHWIDANVETFRRVMRPLADSVGPLPGLARSVNTGSMAVSLTFLANNVLGQYDPLLLGEAADDHKLYFVHPNIGTVAASLDVEEERFRRWIAFHEVTHAAEFGAAPWLPEYLESRVERGVEGMVGGEGGVSRGLDPDAFAELQAAMTAVEGYAEVLMDRAFDGEYADLRAKLDERRGGGGPVRRLAQRLLGLGLKRRQY